VVNIGAGNGYPAGALSNFTPRNFVFRGVECNSLEGALQALKFDKPHIAAEVCKLAGLQAKRRGQKRNKAWKSKQTLWWAGEEFRRDSREYQTLIRELYDAVADQCESFRRALLATNDAVLKHSIGSNKITETVLTEREFVMNLTRVRKELQSGNS
jgi:predicted NAD-dependent protein-ADP-ribosyltransferase YbiA (DUF1768 family)